MIELRPHQKKAVKELSDGKVLVGGVGTGKTLTALVYYVQEALGADLTALQPTDVSLDLYVFTTARKRDEGDWQRDASKLGIFKDRENSALGVTITVDSYNNIGKYEDLKGAFLILDEQRMVGSGAWVKTFLKMAKKNRWIMLSATPGDKWEDYIPLFVANGFYKNRTQFKREHIVYNNFAKFPKVDHYIGVGKLVRLRNQILVEMPYERHTTRHIVEVSVQHDQDLMDEVIVKRWHIYEQRPLKDVGEMFLVMRKLANTDPSRMEAVYKTLMKHDRLIIFYNFDYELEQLRELHGLDGYEVAEWNGHKHQEVPTSKKWVYLVQYMAGAEAWNCVQTNAILFYGLTYSYRNFEQAQGRIDRLNTPYSNLYYYVLKGKSPIDLMIWKALKSKKSFNEREVSRRIDW